jgi:CRISPR-associated protein Csm1
MNDHKSTLYKAALLHDIGKFWQRTKEQLRWTAHPKLSELFTTVWLEDEEIDFFVRHHHEKDLRGKKTEDPWLKTLAGIICEADTLSSGERSKDVRSFELRPMHSIFDHYHYDSSIQKVRHFQPIGSFTPTNYTMPVFLADFKEELHRENYREKWEDFFKEADIEDAYPETILELLKKYLWCIPSSYSGFKPDISLYEHTHTTAAIAVCMHDFFYRDNPSPEPVSFYKIKKQEEERYLLLSGDFTGIQNFLYDISHKGAVKALKGRSFWVQQMTESIARWVAARCGVYNANILYASGGKFYVLLPNLDSLKNDLLPVLKQELDKRMSYWFDDDLGIVWDFLLLSGMDLKKNVPNKWEKLDALLDLQKKQRFSASFNPDFFSPQAPFGVVIQCQNSKKDLCRREELNNLKPSNAKNGFLSFDFPDERKVFYHEEDAYQVSPEQYVAQSLGQDIRNNRSILVSMPEGDYDMAGTEKIDFFSKVIAYEHIPTLERITLLNQDNIMAPEFSTLGIPTSWKFYGGDWIPKEDNETRDFDRIISDAMGIERLGVLRMDVDNLGKIFACQIVKPSFSRIVQLSAMLDFFFSGYLNCLKDMYWTVGQGIVKESELSEAEALALADEDNKSALPLRDILQIVYAGGDDLFIVSTWNVLPDLAWWIHQKFKEFTCNNPCFELSAGIALFDNKYPVYKAAKYAGQALDDAKGKWADKNGKPHEKGRISFLGKAMSWKDFEISRHLSKELYKTKGELKRGLVSRLEEMYDNYFSVKQQLKWLKKYEPQRGRPFDKAEYSKWRWRGCYSLFRFAEQGGRSKAEYIRQLASGIFTSNYQFENKPKPETTDADFITFLDVPVRWADLLIRTKK